GIVGESGCGKTTLGLSVIGLLPKTVGVTGSISYKGTDLVHIGPDQMRGFRGTEIAMIFQEPLTSLNPVYRVGEQIAEAILLRKLRKDQGKKVEGEVMQKVYRTDAVRLSRLPKIKRRIPTDLRDEIVQWLTLVRIGDPEQVMER